MPGPWDKYAQQAAPEAPVIAPPDPYKQANEQRAQEAAARAGRAEERADRAEVRADAAAARSAELATAGSVEQNKSAGFLRRAINAEKSYGNLGDVQPRSLPGQAFSEAFPNAANYISDSDRQMADQAEREFIAAILRYDSGAAIPPQEFVTQGQIYFPRPGDSPEVLRQKARSRREAISGLLRSSGPAGDAVWNEVGGLGEAPAAEGPQDDGNGVTGVTTDEGLSGAVVTDESPALGPDGNPRVSGNDPGYMQIAAGVGDVVQGGLNNTIGLLANPVNTNLFRSLGYEGYTSDIGQTAREALGLPYGNETIGAINQAAAGGFSGAGLANMAARNILPGVARNALVEYGSRPVLDTITGGTAAASGELARQAGAGPVGQAAAIVAGGAAPSALMGGRNALLNLRGGNPPPDFDPALVRAGERQNIPIRQPDAIPSRRGDTAALETSQRGGPIIQQARANDNALIEQRVGDLGGEGAAQEPYPLGQQVQGAGRRYIERTGNQKNELYSRAEQLANGQRINPQQAVAAVDRNIAELEASGANTNSAVIGYLRQLREDLSKSDGFSITEFQALRSAANKKIRGDQALTVSDADRRLSDVVRSFSADASEQLPDAASAALDQADTFYAQRQDFINGVLRSVMGTRGNPLPAERAGERLVAMTKGKGDFDRFSRMWGELTSDEQADVAATIAQSLGRKANGEFSVSTLIRSLDPKSGVSPRTARLIFGADGARALSDLRAIAQAKTATATALNNSRTGTVVNRVGSGLKTLLWGSLGLTAGGPAGAIAAPVGRELLAKWGEERAARALMNPTFTKWLRNAPEATDPRAINAYFRRLEQAAAKSPILAGDVRGLQEALSEAFAKSPTRAAASQQEDN